MDTKIKQDNKKKPKGRMSAYTFFVQTCREEHRKKVLGTSCDVYRPAASEQRASLGELPWRPCTRQVGATGFPTG
jgi:hypothetical protein